MIIENGIITISITEFILGTAGAIVLIAFFKYLRYYVTPMRDLDKKSQRSKSK